MISTFFFELFYTVWPTLSAISMIPFVIVFYVFFHWFSTVDLLMNNSSSFQSSLILLSSIWLAVLYTSGFLFLEIIFIRTLRRFKRTALKLSRSTWLKVTATQLFVFLFVSFIHLSALSEDSYRPTPSLFTYISTYFTFFCYAAFITLITAGVVKSIHLLLHQVKFFRSKIAIPQKISHFFLALFTIYPFFAVVSLMIWLFIDPTGNPQASRFATLNAAIKNTCFIDPQREHCPHTLKEISYIEPEKFQEALNCCQMNYQYDPQHNLYTFVVRYRPNRAVVFDWRLVETEGIDLKEYDVAILGQDRLLNPPDYYGPWTFPDWEYGK